MYFRDLVAKYDEVSEGKSDSMELLKAQRAFLEEHRTTKYVPYQTKEAAAKATVRAAAEATDEKSGKTFFLKNTPGQYLLFVMRLVALYTDIEFDSSEIYDAYNALNERGIFAHLFMQSNLGDSLVPQSEYAECKMLLDMAEADYMENFRSLTSRLETAMASAEAYVERLMEQVVQNVASGMAEQTAAGPGEVAAEALEKMMGVTG